MQKLLLSALSAMLLAPALTRAADSARYPVKPVRIIVPTASGGGSDFMTKLVGQTLAAKLGQPFVLDNRPGGAGMVGLEVVARAAPDGYTLALLSSSNAASMNLYAKPPFDMVNDFSAITQTTSQPYVLVVHPGLAATSVKDLIALAKAKPGALSYASSGTGGMQHLAGASLAMLTNITLVHVAFKGGSPALNEVISGQSQMSFNTIILAGPHIKAGRVRALAVTTAKRSAALPGVPAMSETVPGYNVDTWYGFAAPAKTPVAIIDLLHREMVAALSDSEVKAKLLAEGSEVVGSTPKEFAAYIKTEIQTWGKVIKQAGIKL